MGCDPQGNEVSSRCANLSKKYVKPNGRLVTIGGQPNEKRVKEQGITVISYIGSPSMDQLGAIAKLVSEGKVDVKITETFPMTLEGVRMRIG
ncbi:zinc-binding dehydrogenase [Paenibacillus filicis]|uniref:Zinc-binding dehydrogenase n=1 Tax=Paenibacillus filicis TaxID=669464 RepID=A0ABU9DMH5_9BACL